MLDFTLPIDDPRLIGVAVLINLLVQIVKTQAGPKFVNSKRGGQLLALLPMTFGALIGLLPHVLPGANIGSRILIGAVAGALSNTLYALFKERIQPGKKE